MKTALAVAIAALLFIAVESSGQSRADLLRLIGRTIPATIVSIADGDTVRARIDGGATIRIRLEGIDTPERGEPFSTQAKRHPLPGSSR